MRQLNRSGLQTSWGHSAFKHFVRQRDKGFAMSDNYEGHFPFHGSKRPKNLDFAGQIVR